MPESPEVQALVDFLAERVIGRRIRGFEVLDFRVLKSRPAAQLTGERINAVLRSGKYIEFDCGDDHLVCSLGRHGWVIWQPQQTRTPDRDAVARVLLDDGAGFDLVDRGDFRSVALWTTADALDVPGIKKLGTDPADPTFTRADVARAVQGRRKQLKAVLQEQESFAGIGNAYSDEILFAARLSPTRLANTLGDAEIDRLFEAMRGVIRGAIADRRGLDPADMKAAKTAAMRVHGRGGEPCPEGNGTIVDIAFAGTTAQYCPACQDEPA